MKSKSLLFLILALMIFGGHHATASTCTPLEFDEAARKADIIFLGKVIERSSFMEQEGYSKLQQLRDPLCGGKTAQFDVYKVWKGNDHAKTTVYSIDACTRLGSYLQLNHLYIVFANKNTIESKAKRQGMDIIHDKTADYIINETCDGTENLLHMGLPMIDLINDLDALSSE